MEWNRTNRTGSPWTLSIKNVALPMESSSPDVSSLCRAGYSSRSFGRHPRYGVNAFFRKSHDGPALCTYP
jgi:hypothetical protein